MVMFARKSVGISSSNLSSCLLGIKAEEATKRRRLCKVLWRWWSWREGGGYLQSVNILCQISLLSSAMCTFWAGVCLVEEEVPTVVVIDSPLPPSLLFCLWQVFTLPASQSLGAPAISTSQVYTQPRDSTDTNVEIFRWSLEPCCKKYTGSCILEVQNHFDLCCLAFCSHIGLYHNWLHYFPQTPSK